MSRRRIYPRLCVNLNGERVGYYSKQPSGAVNFQYAAEWLENEKAIPVSLSLPLREKAYSGQAVTAVFENLLPDSDVIKRRVAERVGAAGVDAYSLLSQIGRDCVGALQFIAEDEVEPVSPTDKICGIPIADDEIEQMLNNLTPAPLGLGQHDDFRISVAGAQEKTALLFHDNKWLKPQGQTATTHIFKTQIGKLPSGIDFSNSVENEYYCLRLMRAFGLPVAHAEMKVFGKTKALVIERFDRVWLPSGELLRVPQEDCCQALSIPPTKKYQSDHGPGMVQILNLLKQSDTPEDDQRTFIRTQFLFWLIGATDGHAKNFSVFLGVGGRFRLTPLYDVLTAQPSIDAGHVEMKKMKLAMSVGDNNHYKIDEICKRHFIQTVSSAGLPSRIAEEEIKAIADLSKTALKQIEAELPAGFPIEIHRSVCTALLQRLETMG